MFLKKEHITQNDTENIFKIVIYLFQAVNFKKF